MAEHGHESQPLTPDSARDATPAPATAAPLSEGMLVPRGLRPNKRKAPVRSALLSKSASVPAASSSVSVAVQGKIATDAKAAFAAKFNEVLGREKRRQDHLAGDHRRAYPAEEKNTAPAAASDVEVPAKTESAVKRAKTSPSADISEAAPPTYPPGLLVELDTTIPQPSASEGAAADATLVRALTSELNRAFPDLVNYVSLGAPPSPAPRSTWTCTIRCISASHAQRICTSLRGVPRTATAQEQKPGAEETHAPSLAAKSGAPDEVSVFLRQHLCPSTARVVLPGSPEERAYWSKLPLRVHNAARRKAARHDLPQHTTETNRAADDGARASGEQEG